MENLKIAKAADNDENVSLQMLMLRNQLGAAMRIADGLTNDPVEVRSKQPVNDEYVRKLLSYRRNRGRFFPDELFADPAWDILLELYAAALAQLRVSVSNLCDGAAVPATTALRWIKQLEDLGLIDRRADPTDGRRTFLMLSQKGIDGMNAYFRTVSANAALI